MNPSDRTSHPSRSQVETLLDFLEKNPSLAKGFPKLPSAREAARKAWANIAMQLNSLRGCGKSWKQWTKYWADKKNAVKRKEVLRSQTRNKTNGDSEVVELNDIEERILTLIGGETVAVDDSNYNVFGTSTTACPRRCKSPMSPLSQLQPHSTNLTERLLRIEEQRIEVEHRNAQTFERLVNHEIERDRINNQTLMAIGEGLKLLAEAVKNK